jgi:hypothetical protein
MKFVTTVIILLLHLPGFAQLSVNVYAHLTQTGSIGSLSFDKTMSLGASPLSATGGPVYKAIVSHLPPFLLYRNDANIGTVSSGNVYPVGAIRGDLQFYGEERSTGYFSVRYVYEMVAPHQVIAELSSGTQTCANSAVTLRSADNWPLLNDNIVSSGVVWEYNLNGTAAWVALDSSTSYSYSFIPMSYMNVTGMVNVRFRCRMKAEYDKRVYYSPYSTVSDFYTIIPAAPVVKNMSELLIVPACAGKANGQIYLPGAAISSGEPLMYWLLRPGNVTTVCTTNCGDLVDWSNGADSVSKGVNITGVKAGAYTLWLVNSGGSAGNCLTPVKVVVPEVAALSLAIKSVAHIGCNGARDGVISVQASGGAGYSYSLQMPGGAVLYNTSGTWKDLEAGTYEAMVSDTTCNDVQRVRITLTEPAKIVGTIHVSGSSCNQAPDGSIAITAPGAGIRLYNETGVLQGTLSGLPAGKYTIRLFDIAHPACPAWDTPVSIAGPVPLELQLIKADSVSCQAANDGHLQVLGNGSLYELSGPVQMSNTTGDFDHLPAGDYTVQARRNNTGCGDVATGQYTIHERPPLELKLENTPITCYNAANGYLQADVSGGTGSYHYTWEKLREPAWFALGRQVQDVAPGTYRVRVTDRECSVTSDTLVFTNPMPVSVDEVRIREAVCLEEGAAFEVSASGGDGKYTIAYSADHGETYTPPGPITIAGEYDIRVEDGRGCMAWAADTYTITLPDSLYFQTTVSNITCRGNDDGRMEVNASGNAYGLSFSLDNNVWQESPVFEGLSAGVYTAYVMDDRGCKKSSAVQVSEDTTRQALKILLTGNKGVYCGADTTGELSFITSGGTAPYTYSLDHMTWSTTPAFSGLPAGTYTIHARDVLGCAAKYDAVIAEVDPALYLTARVMPVRCYGTPTGALDITATGGDGIYHYYWQETALNTGNLDGLKAGQYHLVLSDGAGCMVSGEYTIPQPPLLTMTLNTVAVCDGLDDGVVRVLAKGGTAAYAYSLKDADWGSDSLFTHLAAGRYTVAVRDANDCLLEEEVLLGKRNTQPLFNFLVVSQDNATDTLAVREICLPAPDTVSWEFSPGAEWLGTDLYQAPLIRFSRQGDYWVKMYATFGACTYELQKGINILPYDPLSFPVYQLPASIIDTVIVSPNPNRGYFTCKVQLNRKQQTTLSVYDLNGRMMQRKQYAPALLIADSFDLGNVLSGMYLLRVLTENDSKDVPFIISQF